MSEHDATRQDRPHFNARFAAFCAADVIPPLSWDAAEPCVVVDSRGHDVLTVDVDRARSDADVDTIVRIVVRAVNEWCGFFSPRDLSP